MSHFKERVEPKCLNCNAVINGRYCHICGQENIEPVESTWHLVKHFFNDLTHFDGKFFSTVKYLVTKPGFVSSEYLRGRRQSYLNPIRMYIFTSAAFFLFFFSVLDPAREMERSLQVDQKGENFNEVMAIQDSGKFAEATARINNGKPLSRDEFQKLNDSLLTTSGLSLTNHVYRSNAEYDSMLASGAKKHNWLQRTLIRRQIALNQKYNNNTKLIFSSLINTLFHYFPQLLFVSLPLYALTLLLLYNRKKNLLYTHHLIFSVHFYIVIFIFLFVLLLVNELNEFTGWGWLDWMQGLILIGLLFYEYKALRTFYRQGRLKTIIKFILLLSFRFFIILILFLVFLFFSFLKI